MSPSSVLSMKAERVYGALLKRVSDGSPHLRVRHGQLMRELAMSRSTVHRAIEELQDEGLLHRPERGRIRLRIRADMRGADLTRADLNGQDLTGVDLSGATLRGASLRGARLVHANLSDADLTEADLTGADLRRIRGNQAVFHGTCLRRSTLRKADLCRSQFVLADLRGADISAAYLHAATLRRCTVEDTIVSGFFDPTEHWSAVDLTGTDINGFRSTQNNHILAAKRFFEIDSTAEGRNQAARVEAVMFGCYPEIIEDTLRCAPRVFLAWHRGLDEMYAAGRLDWMFYFYLKLETAMFHERLNGRHPDELLQALIPAAPHRLLHLYLKSCLSTVLPHGYSGVGVGREELEDLTGGVVSSVGWSCDRSYRHPPGMPAIPRRRLKQVVRVMEALEGISVAELTKLMGPFSMQADHSHSADSGTVCRRGQDTL